MCPDPDLTSTNCDGETSTVQIGTDLASGQPNKRLAVVKRDNRTIVNDDALTAPGNNGDLPGGLKVNVCSEDAEQPYAARINDTSGAAGTDAAGNKAPQGPSIANALRIQQAADGSACGLIVAPPRFTAVPNPPRVSIGVNNTPGPDTPPVHGAKIKTLTLTNPDTVPRLFRVKGRFSMLTHNIANADAYLLINYRIQLNDNPTDHTDTTSGGATFVQGTNQYDLVATLFRPADGNNRPLNDQRTFCAEVILEPGQTRYLHFFSRTYKTVNVQTAGGTNPDRGINIAGVSIEEQYAVGGA